MTRSGLVFEQAGPTTLTEALRFRDAVYTRDRGYLPSNRMDAEAQHFVAIASQQVVGYSRLLGPAARPFDFEESVDLGPLLGPAAKPALVGRLCVHPAYRQARWSLRVSSGLMDLILQYAAQSLITDLVLYTYDDLRAFYRGARFVDTQITFIHKEWGTVRLMLRNLSKISKITTAPRVAPRTEAARDK